MAKVENVGDLVVGFSQSFPELYSDCAAKVHTVILWRKQHGGG